MVGGLCSSGGRACLCRMYLLCHWEFEFGLRVECTCNFDFDCDCECDCDCGCGCDCNFAFGCDGNGVGADLLLSLPGQSASDGGKVPSAVARSDSRMGMSVNINRHKSLVNSH